MKNFNSITILTGAGISAESGIETFRSDDGLWGKNNIKDIATVDGFKRNPTLVHNFHNKLKEKMLDDSIKPNVAHIALSLLEREFNGEVLLITQNIDNLHEVAGSESIIHMHGELLKVRCQFSGEVFEYKENISTETKCPCCSQEGRLRPNVVWFEEMPMEMDCISTCLKYSDLFISIGTSGNVYPAARFVEVAKSHGSHTVEINLEPSNQKSHFDEGIYGLATETVPIYVDKLLKSNG